jgi:transposase
VSTVSIKLSIQLTHDLQAHAGQVLVQLASGQVHVVAAEVFEAMIGAASPASTPRAIVEGLLLDGATVRAAAARSGVPVGTIAAWRRAMSKAGLLPEGKNPRGRARKKRMKAPRETMAPRKPYVWRSEETRERAREKGRRLQQVVRERRAQAAAE